MKKLFNYFNNLNTKTKISLLFVLAILVLAVIEIVAFLHFPLPAEYFFLFLFGFIFTLVVFYKPFWGLCLFVFMIPFETVLLVGEGVTALKPIGLIVFMGWLIYFFLSKTKKIFFPFSIKISIIFAIWAFASSLWAVSPDSALETELMLILLICFFFVTPQIITNLKKLYYLILSNVFGSTIAGGIGLYFFALHPEQRISALAENAEHYAIAISLAIFYFFILAISKRNKSIKTISFIMFIALLIAAFSSQTRGFIVAIVFSFFFFLVYLLYNQRQALRKSVFILCLISIIITLIMPPIFLNRIESIVTLSDRGAGRVGIWKTGIVMFIENPILGVGLGNAWLNYAKYRDKAIDEYKLSIVHPGALRPLRDLHSVYLRILAELGIIGFIFFSLLILSLIKNFWGSFKQTKIYSLKWRLGVIIGLQLSSLLIFCIAEPILQRKYLWFGLALTLVYYKIINNDIGNKIENKTAKQI